MSNLHLRIIFGSIYVAVMVFSVLASSPYFEYLMAIFTILSVRETAILANKKSTQQIWVVPIIFGFSIVLITIFGANTCNITTIIVCWAIQILCLFLGYLWLKNRQQIGYVTTSVYVFLPLIVVAIWFSQQTNLKAEYLLFYFTTIWLYDSMAYVVGKQWGKRPIFPIVSPKKTIEGTLGGLFLTLISMYVLNKFSFFLPVNPLVLCVIIIFFAILGDFCESYMKRIIGVKESGNLIPGHGGILDRMDSIYLSLLPYLVTLSIIG